MSTKKLSDTNLYELFGIEINADQLEIRKAYRKKALECHPDKNPDNPKAAELFHELARALEVLTDESARAAYDKVLRAKKAAAVRAQQLDSNRKKLKADLEARERNVATQSNYGGYKVNKAPEEVFRDEVARLRREGSKLLDEELNRVNEIMRQSRNESQRSMAPVDSSQFRIKLKWNVKKEEKALNGGYTEEKLRGYLKKYGDIVALVMSKKPGTALLEYTSFAAAEMAISYEKGLLENPLQIEWLAPLPKTKATPAAPCSTDFESLVMRKLRQAEERKRLIAQMQQEQDENQ